MKSHKPIFLVVMLSIFFCCTNNRSTTQLDTTTTTTTTTELESNLEDELISKGLNSPQGNTIQSRIITPKGYQRTVEPSNSYQTYLRNLKLKPHGAEVKYFDGGIKPNNNVYTAVIDLPIGDKNLHQCADAVMRLRAEYLWFTQQYDQIHFNFTNGHRVEYKEWMIGKRMKIKGNKTWWEQQEQPSNTYADFWNYMELIFMYAGTSSLEKELKPVSVEEAQIGDVLITGGFPGHAVIIVDKAIHDVTQEQIFLLAQSYMPAQEIHLLSNQNSVDGSPWYQLKVGVTVTPEWSFQTDHVMRF